MKRFSTSVVPLSASTTWREHFVACLRLSDGFSEPTHLLSAKRFAWLFHSISYKVRVANVVRMKDEEALRRSDGDSVHS